MPREVAFADKCLDVLRASGADLEAVLDCGARLRRRKAARAFKRRANFLAEKAKHDERAYALGARPEDLEAKDVETASESVASASTGSGASSDSSDSSDEAREFVARDVDLPDPTLVDLG